MAQAAAITGHQAALSLAQAAIGWAESMRRRTLTLAAPPYPKNSKACILAAAAAALACIAYQNAGQWRDAVEPARNQTIAFRQDVETGSEPEEAQPSEEEEDEAGVAAGYARRVQTVRIFNSAPAQNAAKDFERISARKPSITSVPAPVANGKSAYRGEGIASWYGSDFHGRKTANGERYDMNGISAAHRTMPLPSYARVTNLDNGRSIIVRVNNRGPFVHHRIVDLSTGAAKALDFYKRGTAHVRVEYVARAPAEGSDNRMLLATLRSGMPAPAPDEVMVASAKALPSSDEKAPHSNSER